MIPKIRKKALLRVDVLNDFCPGGALPVSDGDKVVCPLNRITLYALEHGWLVIDAQDRHPAKTSHFAMYGGKWPVHCVKNTNGAEPHPQLYPYAEGGDPLDRKKVVVVYKGTGVDEDAYSAFDGKTSEGKTLLEVLQENGITDLYVGGLATDYCDKATALDALKNGFRTYLLTDACRAVNINPDDGKNAIIEMLKAGVLVTTTDFAISK
jgi:nicotinamidase/pyrazinamidase